MNTTVTTTNTTQQPTFTVAVAIDKQSAILIAVALFVALVGALTIYNAIRK